ncbi:AlpA family phage regulatory protein [Escherichia coli]|uniref:helix-turn-helix transcriptional regulator n=1 Tax=Escherichia coli TaxID=562 RepID=UPI0030059DE5
MSIKNDGHYFCRAGGNRPDGLNEPVTVTLWRWEKNNPEFPKSIRISKRVSVYDAQEIRQWVKAQSAGLEEVV